MPRHVALPGGLRGADLKRRLGLLEKLERDFAECAGRQLVTDHREVYQRPAEPTSSPRLSVFDLVSGAGQAARSLRPHHRGTWMPPGPCLIEAGVTFVEVNSGGVSATTNWDTHTGPTSRGTSGGRLRADTALSALIQDLKECGNARPDAGDLHGASSAWTPPINGNAGRDHFARAFSIALAGGGIRGGQAIGATDPSGDRGGLAPCDHP